MTFEEYEKTDPVRWPVRRHSLVWNLYELASPEFQQERWIEMKPGAPGQMYGFDFVIHFIFDDIELGEAPERTIGGILVDELEVSAIRHVVEALNHLLHYVGLDKGNIDYISSPNWSKVIDAARKAYRLMRPRLEAEGDALLPPHLMVR